MRKHEQVEEGQGYDSFLDIVANLVGILLILIIVIGAQAADAMLKASSQQAENEAEIDVAQPKSTSVNLENDINAVNAKIKREEMEIDYRRRERDMLHTRLTALEHGLKQEHSQLDGAKSQRVEMLKQLEDGQRKLQELQQTKWILENDQPETKVIEHIPTPMAKTVFGTEVHFRLAKDRLLFIPWDQLLDRLKKEAPTKLWKLDKADEVSEKVGPIYGFWLNYTIRRMRQRVDTQAGVAVRTSIGVEQFHIEGVDGHTGERVSEAMKEASMFQETLAKFKPAQTTVTIWVYPESFELFREVRAMLHKQGYAVAARPLPKDHPIGGSIYGSRSTAQ